MAHTLLFPRACLGWGYIVSHQASPITHDSFLRDPTIQFSYTCSVVNRNGNPKPRPQSCSKRCLWYRKTHPLPQFLPNTLSIRPCLHWWISSTRGRRQRHKAWEGSWGMFIVLEPNYRRRQVGEIGLGCLHVCKSQLSDRLEGKLGIPETEPFPPSFFNVPFHGFCFQICMNYFSSIKY